MARRTTGSEKRPTFAQLNALLDHERRESEGLRRQLEEARRKASEQEATLGRISQEMAFTIEQNRVNVEREQKYATLQVERYKSLRTHVEIALRACRRGRTRKKKASSLQQARVVLEAAIEEDGTYESKLLLHAHQWLPGILMGGAAMYYILKGALK